MSKTRSFQLASAAALAAILLAGSAFAADKKPVFDLMSPGHKEFGSLSKKNAGNMARLPGCDGGNVSPALSWSGAPPNTKSYAIELFDLAGIPPLGLVHWVAYDIPATKTSLKEGEASKPSTEFKEGKNQIGTEMYFGPCPPPGAKAHPFTFMVMATDLEPGSLQPGMTLADLATALKGHIIDRTTLVLRYGH